MENKISLFILSSLIAFCSFGQIVLNEDFSSGSLPTGWTETSVAQGVVWAYGNTVDFGPSIIRPDASGNLGEYASMDFTNDPDTSSLITPVVSILGITNPRLTFQYITQSSATNFSPWNRLIVDYWNGRTWLNITVIDTLTSAGWTSYEFNISNYTFSNDSVQFRFSAQEGGAAIGGTGSGTFNQDMALDEVIIESTPTCFKPTSLFTNSVATGIELNWTENNAATQWEVEYGTLGFSLSTGIRNTVSTNPSILTMLTVGTSYDWYIRSICAVGDTSYWTKGNSFLYAGPPLAGTYTINASSPTSGTNFGSFADFATRLNLTGISDSVIVNVANNTYNEQFSLGNISGSSSVNTITIDGGSAASTIITHNNSSRNSTIAIDGSSYVTIKNMTIIATGTGSDTWGVNIFGSSDHINIDSNIIIMPPGGTSDVAGVNICNETSDQSSGFYGYDIIISNNTVSGGERGITAYGNNNAPLRNTNISVINNNIQNTDDYGIFVWGYDTVNISNNYCLNAINNTTNDGLYVSDIENFVISGNYAKGSDNGFFGNDLNFGIPTTKLSSIVNNMFIGGDDGIYLDDIEQIEIFHNSTHAEDLGIRIGDDLNLDIRNNIFTSNSDYAFYTVGPSNTMALDFNIYYTLGNDLAYFNTAYTDIVAFKLGEPSLNFRSLVGDPLYNSPTTDLHVSGSLANDVADSSIGIKTDIDGDIRPLAPSTVSDIGADEYKPQICLVPSGLVTQSITPNSAFVTWVESGSATDWEVEYGPTGFVNGTGTILLRTDTFATLTNLTIETHYEWRVRAICARTDSSVRSSLNFYTGYCNPSPLSAHGLGITGVAFDTVNNITGSEPGNYGNFSSLIGTLPNNSQAIVDITYSTGFQNLTKIWIDWNQDLDFDDAGEEVYSGTSGSANPTTLNASFFIPPTIPIGLYKMRIGGADNNSISPCYSSFWGSFEDYSVNIIAGPAPFPFYSIATINTENSAGLADSIGVNCGISGTVVGIDRRDIGYEFTIIDMSSGSQEGITVFSTTDLSYYPTPTEGDSLIIEGTVSQFNGLTQIDPISINLNSTGKTIPVSISTNTLGENTESKWINLTSNFVSLSTSGSGSFNINITNGIDTLIMRIDSDTDIDDTLTAQMLPILPGDTICNIIGIGGQFDSSSPYTEGYQILPMRWTDLNICRLPVGITKQEIEEFTFNLVPNPSNGQFEIRTLGFKNSMVNITVRDLNGRIISNQNISNANRSFKTAIDLSENAKGIYFVSITDGIRIINEKLILK
jgi:hypothetical protein